MASNATENTPPSRPSTVESGPIPLFDAQLKILTESYLAFFQERKKIEDVYVESLLKLHRKVKNIDTALDERAEMSTARKAWNEVRDNIEREAQVRQAFLNTLVIDVVQPLTSLMESQDRTRKRIKEDLKASIGAYNEHADNVLPRLKRTYLKKCQEVEDHKHAASLPMSSSTTAPDNQPNANSKSNIMSSPRPVVTSPQPLRPLERRPSTGLPAVRSRSPPPAASPFSDLAHHGKKQLNQLIGGVKEGLGGRPVDSGLRAVRAKREADDADKEYRKAVHWMETLRLQRVKVSEGAYKSLEMFMQESAETVKGLLEKYADNMIATTTTQTHISGHARKAVEQISPQKDASKLAATFPRSSAFAVPKPILYYNYNVGECDDLIFGVSLVHYATGRCLADGEIPKIVRICIKEVDQRGLDSEGIYRVSGRHAVVQALQHKIERNEREFEFKPVTDDVYAVSSFLKLYLRQLPEPVFRFGLQDRLQHTEDIAEHQSNNFMLLRSKIRRLPPVHQATLKAVMEHLARVVSHSDKNKMDAKNLAIAFGGVIFGEDEMPKGSADLLVLQSSKDSLMEDLINNASSLFDENAVHHSPPLPPTPAGEPIPSYAYGTSHTKVVNVPSTSHKPRSASEDFTPPLPPRPANSIHPSLRANPIPPSKGDFPLMRPEKRSDNVSEHSSGQSPLNIAEGGAESSTLPVSEPSSGDATLRTLKSPRQSRSPRTSKSSTTQSEVSAAQSQANDSSLG